MKFFDILQIPLGLDIDTYEETLKNLDKLSKEIRKLSDKHYELQDTLQVLADECGSERYTSKLDEYVSNSIKLQNTINEYNEIASRLNRSTIHMNYESL